MTKTLHPFHKGPVWCLLGDLCPQGDSTEECLDYPIKSLKSLRTLNERHRLKLTEGHRKSQKAEVIST